MCNFNKKDCFFGFFDDVYFDDVFYCKNKLSIYLSNVSQEMADLFQHEIYNNV